jgi:hypothetical protein
VPGVVQEKLRASPRSVGVATDHLQFSQSWVPVECTRAVDSRRTTREVSQMLAMIKRFWHKLPLRHRTALRRSLGWSGIPYALSYAAGYRDSFSARNFAGELVHLHDEYRAADAEMRTRLEARIAEILDTLILPNGVKKTTYPMRQSSAIAAFLQVSEFSRGRSIRVLDVPSSTGISSLTTLQLLRDRFTVNAYVLGDLAHRVYWDRERHCIFDDQSNLLQVKTGDRFFSIYRGHTSGDVFPPLAKLWLYPMHWKATRLVRRYAPNPSKSMQCVLLVHPDVERMLDGGVISVESVNVFDDGQESFDLVLSFNLLQRNYFAAAEIQRGLDALASRLYDGGYLITGNTESFAIMRKTGNALVEVMRNGVF